MNKLKYIILSIVSLITISACKEKKNAPDTSNITVTLKILRFDQDLFNTDVEKVKDSIPFFEKKYGEFFNAYNFKIVNLGNYKNPAYPELLQNFLTDFTMRDVYKSVEKTYPNLDTIKAELTNAFKNIRYYFPSITVPVVITYISGFNQSIVTTDTILGISLDKYLGQETDFYKSLGMPLFKRYLMNKAKIPSDAIRGWALAQFPFSDSASNLLSNMVYQGKILEFTKMVLPEEPDSLIFGLSSEQLEWCRNNEEKMWSYLVENKTLFKSDYLTINKYTGESPFTKDFGRHSPPRVANWIGWRIVDSYLQKNPDVKLSDLMHEKDFMEILRLSKYKP
jgi:gliding motility-associated lipoprotein GldB